MASRNLMYESISHIFATFMLSIWWRMSESRKRFSPVMVTDDRFGASGQMAVRREEEDKTSAEDDSEPRIQESTRFPRGPRGRRLSSSEPREEFTATARRREEAAPGGRRAHITPALYIHFALLILRLLLLLSLRRLPSACGRRMSRTIPRNTA